MSLGGYPMGAQNDPNAPYNEKENPEIEVEVTVSITLSKTFKIKTDQYNEEFYGKDEDGFPIISRSFDKCAIDEQAQEKTSQELNISKDWNIDEFVTIVEE